MLVVMEFAQAAGFLQQGLEVGDLGKHKEEELIIRKM
jgi:hypothetical protein